MLFNFNIEAVLLLGNGNFFHAQSVHALSINAWATLERRSRSTSRRRAPALHNNRVAPENPQPETRLDGPIAADIESNVVTRSAERDESHPVLRSGNQDDRGPHLTPDLGGRRRRIPT